MRIWDIGWPKDSEIDIMEYRENEPYITSGAIHFWRGGCEGQTFECRRFLAQEFMNDKEKLSEDFHTYSLE